MGNAINTRNGVYSIKKKLFIEKKYVHVKFMCVTRRNLKVKYNGVLR